MLCGRTFNPSIEPAVAVAADALRDSLAAFAAAKRVDLLFDATNISRSRRAPLIAAAKRFGLTPVAIFVHCPLSIALYRNASRPDPVPASVVAAFSHRLEPPTSDEGFAEVIEIDSSTAESAPSDTGSPIP
jgi:predicted kinase